MNQNTHSSTDPCFDCFRRIGVLKLIGMSMKLTLKDIALFSSIVLICQLPAMVYMLTLYPRSASEPEPLHLLISLFLSFILTGLESLFLTLAMARRLVGLPTRLGWVLINGFRYPFLHVLVGSICAAVIIVAGLMLLILPGLLAFVLLIPMVPLIILEQKSVWAAIHASYLLMKTRLVSGAVIMLYSLILVGIFPGLIEWGLFDLPFSTTALVASTIRLALTVPLGFAPFVLIYASLRGEQGYTAVQLREALYE